MSRPTISKLWKDRESVKKDGLKTENKERKRKRPFKEEDVERGLKIWLDKKIASFVSVVYAREAITLLAVAC